MYVKDKLLKTFKVLKSSLL